MGASRFEQDLATSKGVRLVFNAQPIAVHGNGAAQEVEFEYTQSGVNGLEGSGETFRIAADQVFRAIGQRIDGVPEGIAIVDGKIAVSDKGRTSVDGIWAGGDCASGGDDLTVTAVAEGRDAAEHIHQSLMG